IIYTSYLTHHIHLTRFTGSPHRGVSTVGEGGVVGLVGCAGMVGVDSGPVWFVGFVVVAVLVLAADGGCFFFIFFPPAASGAEGLHISSAIFKGSS
ncbi:MAG: hypothetical protein ACK53Y_00030, partial [bacterium]